MTTLLRTLRKKAQLSQTEMAGLIGLKLRQYQEIESQVEPLRKLQQLAVDMASMRLAIRGHDPSLLTSGALTAIAGLARYIHPEDRTRLIGAISLGSAGDVPTGSTATLTIEQREDWYAATRRAALAQEGDGGFAPPKR